MDDFVIPLRILEQGYKVVYEAEAVAHEETTEDYDKEFGRRARIAAGNFQSLRMVPRLLLPTAGFPAFAFWSHKLLRWCAPALMAVALVANLFLLDSVLYRLTLFTQAMFYALAYLGKAGALKGTGRADRLDGLLLRDDEPGHRGGLLALPAQRAEGGVGPHRPRLVAGRTRRVRWTARRLRRAAEPPRLKRSSRATVPL